MKMVIQQSNQLFTKNISFFQPEGDPPLAEIFNSL